MIIKISYLICYCHFVPDKLVSYVKRLIGEKRSKEKIKFRYKFFFYKLGYSLRIQFSQKIYMYIYINTYLENITIELHIIYVFNTHVKF